ncbi:MAG: hypothetical protein ABL997_12205 [Planctomycetota bacterium]
MSEKDDFISFEKALRDLKLRSEELRKLVSEGEIRAFRDGPDSMKFRREDVETLVGKGKGEEELTFADSLEDDTGMVTEQLSSEDTLLAESDEVDDAPRTQKRVARSAPARVPAMAGAAQEKEPGWVTAVGILGFLVMVWGIFLMHSISQEVDPAGSGHTSVFAAKKGS